MHMPSTSDVVIYLVIMPLTLLLSVFAIRRTGQFLLAFSTRSQANSPTGASTTQTNPAPDTDKSGTILIAASTTHTRFGTAASDITDAIKDKKTKFELDSEITDINGYPVFSGRINDLDTTEVIAQFKQYLNALPLPEQTWQTEDLRTITLAHNVCMELAQTLLAQQHDTKPNIYLASVLPSAWSQDQKHQATLWLLDLLSAQGLPQEQLKPNPLNTLNLDDPLLVIDKINIQINQQNLSGMHLIIASHSFIGESTTPTKPNHTPGEAAAGLIITDSQWNTLPTAVQTHRLAQRQLEKSADAAGKTKPTTLIETVEHAIAIAGITKSLIGNVFSDSDERPTRLGELFEAINSTLPDVDVTDNCFQISRYCGEIGKTANLIALATAIDQVKKSEQAALCLCNNDSLIRSAIILQKSMPDQHKTPTSTT
jgi:hypothetical protein